MLPGPVVGKMDASMLLIQCKFNIAAVQKLLMTLPGTIRTGDGERNDCYRIVVSSLIRSSYPGLNESPSQDEHVHKRCILYRGSLQWSRGCFTERVGTIEPVILINIRITSIWNCNAPGRLSCKQLQQSTSNKSREGVFE